MQSMSKTWQELDLTFQPLPVFLICIIKQIISSNVRDLSSEFTPNRRYAECVEFRKRVEVGIFCVNRRK